MLSIESIQARGAPPVAVAPTMLEAPEDPANAAFEQGFLAFKAHMCFLSEQASAYYQTLQQKTAVAGQAQQHIAEVVQGINGGREKVNLSSTVIKFLKAHFKPAEWGVDHFDNPYKQDKLSKIREALLNFSTTQLDFVSESQLQIQRTMQTYNTTVTLMNGLQSTLSEMIKAFIQGIR